MFGLGGDDFRSNVGDRVFFEVASSDLGPIAREVLNAQAEWIGRHPEHRVIVEAHADVPGSHARNDEIARARGERVLRFLIAAGVARERVRLQVLGRRRPAARCTSQACRRQNRRVVTSVQPPSRDNVGSAEGADRETRATRRPGLRDLAGRQTQSATTERLGIEAVPEVARTVRGSGGELAAATPAQTPSAPPDRSAEGTRQAKGGGTPVRRHDKTIAPGDGGSANRMVDNEPASDVGLALRQLNFYAER